MSTEQHCRGCERPLAAMTASSSLLALQGIAHLCKERDVSSWARTHGPLCQRCLDAARRQFLLKPHLKTG
ncbi:MAG: hypothetical protein K8T25_15385 [Planctomycetia bacterium]|nr:hypothetical protein [Planctomycetia bacterium]